MNRNETKRQQQQPKKKLFVVKYGVCQARPNGKKSTMEKKKEKEKKYTKLI